MTRLLLPATSWAAVFLVGTLATATPTQTQSLSSLPNPQQKLKAASVDDSAGHVIGHVDSVQLASGAPLNLKIALTSAGGRSKLVTIAAANLQYDPVSSVVVVDLPQSDIDQMRDARTAASAKP